MGCPVHLRARHEAHAERIGCGTLRQRALAGIRGRREDSDRGFREADAMTLIAIIIVFWLIGCFFPGTGHRRGPPIAEVAAFLVCAVVLLALGQAVLVGGALLAGWLGNPMLFPITTMGLIAAAMTAALVVRFSRRQM
jgi:hypothetical protein